MKTLYLCGAGNSEGVRLALAINRAGPRWGDILLLDDDRTKLGNSLLDVPIVGSFDTLRDVEPESAEVANLVARTTEKRRAAGRRIAAYGIPFASMLSPDIDTVGVEPAGDLMAYQHAILGPEVSLDEGTVVFMGAIVGHECAVGKCCVIAANAVLNARVRLGDGVYVGSNATILPEVTVGAKATIAAGSMVLQDVPPSATAIGVPAQVVATTAPSSMPAGVTPPAGAASPQSTAPSPELEAEIRRIWCAVLGVDAVGAEQNFFDAGGDSLLALRACEQINRETGANVGVLDVFQYPTVGALARRCQGEKGRSSPLAVEPDRTSARLELGGRSRLARIRRTARSQRVK